MLALIGEKKGMFNLKCCESKFNMATVNIILLIVGGLNWGLTGLGMLFGYADSWNVVHFLLGSVPLLEGLVYVLVGIAAVMKMFSCCCCCKWGNSACASCPKGQTETQKTEVGMQ